jgi:hypothetical protein
MIAQSNATLTKVEGQAFSEDADLDATKAPVWEGLAPAYYRERRARVTGPAGSDVLVERFLIVEVDVPPVTWVQGQTATFRRQLASGLGDPETGEVQQIEERRLPGHQNQTTRLTMEVQ